MSLTYPCQGAPRGDGLRRGRLRPRDAHRGHEAVAAAGDGGQEAVAVLAVTQRLAERGDVDPEVALLDEGVGPDAGDKLVLADDLARPLDQGDQDVQRPAAERHRLVALEQELPRREQPERPERHARPDGRRPVPVVHATDSRSASVTPGEAQGTLSREAHCRATLPIQAGW